MTATILKSLGTGFMQMGERSFVYGPQGRLLRRNVESLWFDSSVVAPQYNVFFAAPDEFLPEIDSPSTIIPRGHTFGLASVEDSKIPWNADFIQSAKSWTHRIARVAIFSDAEASKDIFHRKQRERKVWWRKHARNPSTFSIGETKKVTKNRQTVDIMANLSFGNVVVESICYHQENIKKIYPQIAQGREDFPFVHVIEHTASLDWGCLAFLCDGYELSGKSDRGELKIHPKLSPYKVGFYLEEEDAADPNADDKASEKTRLVLYLNNLLKSKGLCTILARTKREIESFHVPWTISVDDASLQNGLVYVTSQLTTIPESVHVTDLPKHVADRCC